MIRYLSPGKVFLLGGKLSQCPQVLPKWSTLNLLGNIGKPVLEACPLTTSATVVWACQLLGCFCSMMEDAICKGNCSWQSVQPGQSFRAPSWERPFALLVFYCCCPEILNHFWTKGPIFLLCNWSFKFSCQSWVAAYIWSSTKEQKEHELWSQQMGIQIPVLQLPSCVSLSRFLNLSELQCSYIKNDDYNNTELLQLSVQLNSMW